MRIATNAVVTEPSLLTGSLSALCSMHSVT